MVQDGIFGTANPTSGALLRNLESFATYIVYLKEWYQIEVEKWQEEERLRRKEQVARQQELQLLRAAVGRIHELEREIACLRVCTGESNATHWNPHPQSVRTPNGWEDDSDAYPYA